MKPVVAEQLVRRNMEILSVGGTSTSSSHGPPSIRSQKPDESDSATEENTKSNETTLHISVLEDHDKEEPTTICESDSIPETESSSEAETASQIGQGVSALTVDLEQERREKCVHFAQGEAIIIESTTVVGELTTCSTENSQTIFSSLKLFFKKVSDDCRESFNWTDFFYSLTFGLLPTAWDVFTDISLGMTLQVCAWYGGQLGDDGSGGDEGDDDVESTWLMLLVLPPYLQEQEDEHSAGLCWMFVCLPPCFLIIENLSKGKQSTCFQVWPGLVSSGMAGSMMYVMEWTGSCSPSPPAGVAGPGRLLHSHLRLHGHPPPLGTCHHTWLHHTVSCHTISLSYYTIMYRKPPGVLLPCCLPLPAPPWRQDYLKDNN